MASQRLHSLDALRASMMLLGLLLHSFISYGVLLPGRASWPYADSSGSEAFDFIVNFIHIWRMPLFFVLAGFFSSLLLIRRGFRSVAVNRASRIGLPFVFGWLILVPLIFSGFIYAIVTKAASSSVAWNATIEYFTSGTFQTQSAQLWHWYYDSTTHLWFLYYLSMFYVVGLLLHYLAQRLPDRIRSLPLQLFGKVVGGKWSIVILSVSFAVFLSLMPHGRLQTSNSFVPDLRTFGGYFLFFCFGWLLYLRRELLYGWAKSAWAYCITGCLLSVVHYLAVRTTILSSETPLTFWVTVVTGAISVWLFTFGLIGLCLRYLDRPSPVVRYFVDASYWLYLVHLPLTIWIPGFLASYEWSPWIKALLVLFATTSICVVTYDLFVRNTFIGKVLNGRRYPRGLPVHEVEGTLETPEAAVAAVR